MNDLSHLKTGFTKCVVTAINPDEEQYEKLMGEEPDELIYTWEREGVQKAKLDIYLQDLSQNVYKHTIYISDEEVTSKQGKYLYINCIGDTQYGNNEDDLWDNFKLFQNSVWENGKIVSTENIGKKDFHISRKGEQDVLHFRKMLLNRNMKDPQANLFLQWDKLLEGDVSRLLKDIPDSGEYHLTCLLYVNEELEQKVWKEFLPVKMLPEIYTGSFSKYTQTAWNKYKSNIENEYIGLKGHYHLGRIKTFEESDFMNQKEFNPFCWEY
jgi:hypothetical protein